GDVEEVALDLDLAELPVVRGNDDGVVVAHVGGDAGQLECLQRSHPRRGGERGAPMLADLFERDLHAADAFSRRQVWELADAGRGVDARRALRETPVDLSTQRVFVEAVLVVGMHGGNDHANHPAQSARHSGDLLQSCWFVPTARVGWCQGSY